MHASTVPAARREERLVFTVVLAIRLGDGGEASLSLVFLIYTSYNIKKCETSIFSSGMYIYMHMYTVQYEDLHTTMFQ